MGKHDITKDVEHKSPKMLSCFLKKPVQTNQNQKQTCRKFTSRHHQIPSSRPTDFNPANSSHKGNPWIAGIAGMHFRNAWMGGSKNVKQKKRWQLQSEIVWGPTALVHQIWSTLNNSPSTRLSYAMKRSDEQFMKHVKLWIRQDSSTIHYQKNWWVSDHVLMSVMSLSFLQ